jgi:hypothetical protein
MSREKQTLFMHNTYSLYIPDTEDNIKIWEDETNRWLELKLYIQEPLAL